MKTHAMYSFALFAFASVAVTGCGDDPVTYSSPVGIELKAESDKVINGSLTSDKNITTESGNPFGAFVQEARNMLGGDPARIEVAEVSMLLGAGSTGVTALNEIFDGRVEVLFEMSDTNDTFSVAGATIDADTPGSGPLAFDVLFDSDAVTGDNLTKLIGGSFKLVYRGPAHADFVGKAAKADLQITLVFEAFE